MSGRRTTRQIRASLHETRRRLDDDLLELQQRVETGMSPKEVLSRHPAALAIAGAVVGFVVIRNPAIVGRALTRIAQASAPVLFRTLVKRGAAAVGSESD